MLSDTIIGLAETGSIDLEKMVLDEAAALPHLTSKSHGITSDIKKIRKELGPQNIPMKKKILKNFLNNNCQGVFFIKTN